MTSSTDIIVTLRNTAAACATLMLLACSDGHDNPEQPAPVKPRADNPTVEGPISGGGGPDCCKILFGSLEVDLRDQGYVPGTPFYAAGNFDLAEVGYRESEYFFSGTAASYSNTEPLDTEGRWSVATGEGAQYNARLVVQRPADPADFNGTVILEWFNVSGGLDAAPDWLQLHTELMRSGYVWVGVSAQAAGIEGGGPFGLPLKTVDAERYGPLMHPGDSYSYDIFSQAGQAVRNPVGIAPLEGLQVERMIGVGQSQSAFRLTTYVNAVHPTIELFDGFLIHGRGASSSALSQEPLPDIPTPDVVFVRDDLPEPVIIFQTETDLFTLNSIASRQPDAAMLRLWEAAGTSHTDAYTTLKGPTDQGDDPSVADVISDKSARPPFIFCDLPVNDGPSHWVAKAAIGALDNWIRTGDEAPIAPRLDITADASAFVLDEHGNVTGGIRSPYVDAPVATLSGLGQDGGFCTLFGVTTLFDQTKLAQLYPDHSSYEQAIDEHTDAAVALGFLLVEDGELIKRAAQNSDIGGAP